MYWNLILNEEGGPWLVAPDKGNPDLNLQTPLVIIDRQSKRITFTNTTANRATTIRINSSQWTSGTWWLIPPPGGGVVTSTFPASTVARNIAVTLVPTGTYTLILVPAGTNVGTVSASVL